MSFELSRSNGVSYFPDLVLMTDHGNQSAQLINKALASGDGDGVAVRFNCPVTTGASGTLTAYFYCTAVGGTPPTLGVQVMLATDENTADGTPIGTDTSATVTSAAGQWLSFGAITSCNLTRGATYILMVDNQDGTPVTNTATMQYRAEMDGGVTAAVDLFGSLRSDDTGWATFTEGNFSIPCVIVFNDGSNDFILGNPYAGAATQSSNQEIRGNRVEFDEDVVISGVNTAGSPLATGIVWVGYIFDTTGNILVTMDADALSADLNTFRCAPFTLVGGTQYIIAFEPGANSNSGNNTTYDMENGTIPTNVQLCGIGEGKWGHVGAVAGSPKGSGLDATFNDEKLWCLSLIIDNHPAISGGGGGGTKLAGKGGGMVG